MSVILDALKKAQNERKDVSKSLPYNPRKKSQKSPWFVYTGALLVFCVLIIFLLIPDKKPPVMEATVVQAPQQTSQPIVAPEKTLTNIQPIAPVNAPTLKQSNKQAVEIHNLKPLKKQNKIATTTPEQEMDNKKPPSADPLQNIAAQNSSNVLITSIDHEKINLKFNEAVKEAEKGNISGAKQLYQSILVEQPSNVEVLNNLGVIALKEGNAREALFYFNKVLQHNKNYGMAYNNIGLLMMKDGQKSLAEEYFRKSIELGKDGVDPSLNLAALLRTEKRYDEAGRLLEGLIKTNKKSKPLYLSYALIKDDMGQYGEAIKYYRLYLNEGGGIRERSEVIERLKVLENVQPLKNN